MGKNARLHTLYQQAVFQATQHYATHVPMKPWMRLVIHEARCWHCAKDYTAYVQAGIELHQAIFAAVSCHPRNEGDLPILHVVHPLILPASGPSDDVVSVNETHFEVVVGWLQEVGVATRIAMDFADALLEDIDESMRFYNTLEDPITSVVRKGTNQL